MTETVSAPRSGIAEVPLRVGIRFGYEIDSESSHVSAHGLPIFIQLVFDTQLKHSGVCIVRCTVRYIMQAEGMLHRRRSRRWRRHVAGRVGTPQEAHRGVVTANAAHSAIDETAVCPPWAATAAATFVPASTRASSVINAVDAIPATDVKTSTYGIDVRAVRITEVHR